MSKPSTSISIPKCKIQGKKNGTQLTFLHHSDSVWWQNFCMRHAVLPKQGVLACCEDAIRVDFLAVNSETSIRLLHKHPNLKLINDLLLIVSTSCYQTKRRSGLSQPETNCFSRSSQYSNSSYQTFEDEFKLLAQKSHFFPVKCCKHLQNTLIAKFAWLTL